MSVNANSDCPSDKVVKLIAQYNQLQTDYTALVTLVNNLKSVFNAHTHTVTHAACSATSAAYATSTPLTSSAGPSSTVTNGVVNSTNIVTS